MSKKSDISKLSKLLFFSKSAPEIMEQEIQQVVQLVKDGRLSFNKGMMSLHNGKDDALDIYWHISTRLAEAQKQIRTLEDYQVIKLEKVSAGDMTVRHIGEQPVVLETADPVPEEYEDMEIKVYESEDEVLKKLGIEHSLGHKISTDVKRQRSEGVDPNDDLG